MFSRIQRLVSFLPFITGTLRNSTLVQSQFRMASSQANVGTFASGCFWGVEHIFVKYYGEKGIVKTSVGYTGGKSDSPTYRQVCFGDTGHAEAVRIEFDPAKLSYADLVEFFYRMHDPTTLNYQGPDRGTQYRSAIFTNTAEQQDIALKVTEEVQKLHFDPKGQKIVTIIEPAGQWWDAEDYHQKYLFKNSDGYECPTHRLHW